MVAPNGGVVAIGSGGDYAASAARALIDIEGTTSMQVAEKVSVRSGWKRGCLFTFALSTCTYSTNTIYKQQSMTIAADTCIYTNHNFVKLQLEIKKEKVKDGESTSESTSEKSEEESVWFIE